MCLRADFVPQLFLVTPGNNCTRVEGAGGCKQSFIDRDRAGEGPGLSWPRGMHGQLAVKDWTSQGGTGGMGLTTPGLYLQGGLPTSAPQDPHKPFRNRFPHLPAWTPRSPLQEQDLNSKPAPRRPRSLDSPEVPTLAQPMPGSLRAPPPTFCVAHTHTTAALSHTHTHTHTSVPGLAHKQAMHTDTHPHTQGPGTGEGVPSAEDVSRREGSCLQLCLPSLYVFTPQPRPPPQEWGCAIS